MKKFCLSVLGVFVVSVLINYLIHCVLLGQVYADTAALWRAESEMNIWLVHTPTFIGTMCFVWIYDRFFTKKSVSNAAYYGAAWGLAAGASMGIGLFAVMPLPAVLGCYWFMSSTIQWIVAGVVTGLVYRKC